MARKSLNLQLQRMGAFSSSECISTYSDIYEKFKICKEISAVYFASQAFLVEFVVSYVVIYVSMG